MPGIHIAGVRLVALDLDDTLYPERSFAYSGFEAVGAWLQEHDSRPFDPAQRLKELFQTPHRPRAFNQLLSEMGIDPAEELVVGMVDLYRRHRPRISLFDDAVRALNRWAGLFRLALVTDGPLISQQNKVAALGLSQWFDEILLTDTWGPAFWKPHPRAFELLENTFCFTGAACVYVGDNAGKDFLAPRRLGWQTVQVCRPDGIHAHVPPPPRGEPTWRVATLDEINITQ
ncbi:MAG TPA: HAD family hydrolase [Phycisphaerae bacterium]|nr:HAD family hydrolase [Phycisphaerae bacterium]